MLKSIKNLFVVIFSSLFITNCFAVEFAESAVNSTIQLIFPKTIKGVEVSNPSIKFLSDQALFCGDAKTKYFTKVANFCTQFTPYWDANKGQLTARNITLQKVQSDGVSEKLINTLQIVLNKEVLPHFNDIKLYQTDNWIGKQIKTLKVMPGKIEAKL